MTYLLRNDLKSSEKIITENIHVIVKKVVEVLGKNIEAILLSGSLGRGTGSAYFNKKIILLGDYDLVCITKRRVFPLKQLNLPRGDMHFANANAPVYVGIVPKSQLPKMKSNIEYFDWKQTAKIIYGNKKILDLLRIDKKIPILHTIEILFNRFKYLVWDAQSFKNQEDKIKFGHMITKVILGIGDIKLIIGGKYHALLNEKYRELKNLGTNKHFIKMYENAIRLVKYPEKVGRASPLLKKTQDILVETLEEINKELGNSEGNLLSWVDYLQQRNRYENILKRLMKLKRLPRPAWKKCIIYPGVTPFIEKTAVFLALSIDLKNNHLCVSNPEYLKVAIGCMKDAGIINEKQIQNKSQEEIWTLLKNHVKTLSSVI